MFRLQIRPSFKLVISLSPGKTVERIRDQIKKHEGKVASTVMNNYIILSIPPEKEHFWSPRLTVEVDEHEKGSVVRGLFGPRPSVWTMFAGFYFSVIILGTVGLIFGLVQWSLKMTPYGLWAVPAAIVLLAVAYGIALSGQNLGLAQMHLLRSVLDKALNSS
ncbi:MAG: hypothetical protein ACE5GL_05295 [Calditrichia bacterium]